MPVLKGFSQQPPLLAQDWIDPELMVSPGAHRGMQFADCGCCVGVLGEFLPNATLSLPDPWLPAAAVPGVSY